MISSAMLACVSQNDDRTNASVREAPTRKKSARSRSDKRLNISIDSLQDGDMPKKPTKPGKAAEALRELRSRVYSTPNFSDLTLAQMAKECGMDSPSSYQYNEDVYSKDAFSPEKVEKFIVPLKRRGIPEDEIKRKLLGNIIVSSDSKFVAGNPKLHVNWNPEQEGRDVPVITRDAFLRWAKGEMDLGAVAMSDPTAARDMEAAGVVIGSHRLSDVSDDVVFIPLIDGRGQVGVDRSQVVPQEGSSYVWQLGNDLIVAEFRDGVILFDEGGDRGNVVNLGSRLPICRGKVIWWMIKGN